MPDMEESDKDRQLLNITNNNQQVSRLIFFVVVFFGCVKGVLKVSDLQFCNLNYKYVIKT